jgi:hypothetical protein
VKQLITEQCKPIASEHEPTEEASASKPTEGFRHSEESKPKHTEESKSKPTQVSHSPMSTPNTKQRKRRQLFTEQQTDSPKSSTAKQPSMTKGKSRKVNIKLFSPSKIKVCFIIPKKFRSIFGL